MSVELAPIQTAPAVNPAMQIIAAKDAAKVCGEIVKRCAVTSAAPPPDDGTPPEEREEPAPARPAASRDRATGKEGKL